jgi:hypothetical protein
MAEKEPAKPAVSPDDEKELSSGEERRRRRSSFVERIGKARGRRRSDHDGRDDQERRYPSG